MAEEIVYLIIVFAVAIIGFTILKRPLNECMLAAFLVLVAVTGTWSDIGSYIWDAMTESSLYVMIVFVISASLLSKTKIIDDCIAIILSLFGHIRGGAGLVAIIGSTYMGSLSGSGPGNVATTGVFSIPAMIHSGFPPHLAANVEAHASTMGNMIPPAGMIAIAFGLLDVLYPETYTISQFWLVLWGIAIYFLIQRILTLYMMCLYYKVQPMPKEDIPSLGAVVKRGWKAIFLPVIVFLPFLLTNIFDAFLTNRIGDGKSALSSSILLFLPSLIVICSVLLSDKKTKEKMCLSYMCDQIEKGMHSLVPTSSLVMFAYFVSNVLAAMEVEVAIGALFSQWELPLPVLALLCPLLTALLGMLIPGSTQVKIFGGMMITVFAAAGADPLLTAAMLPCICGAMHGVTPPYCTCVYVGMGIAGAELAPTIKNCMIWIFFHYILSAMILMGWLPVWGL